VANIQEIWKDIPRYEGYYQISNLGRVKSLERKLPFGTSYRIKKESIMIPKFERYYFVNLAIGQKQKTFRIHRLISESFIPNPNNYPIINHIDGNKANNDISNLEWCTYKHNSNEAIRIGLTPKPIPMKAEKSNNYKLLLNTQTGIFYYGCVDAAESITHISDKSIRAMTRGYCKNRSNFILA